MISASLLLEVMCCSGKFELLARSFGSPEDIDTSQQELSTVRQKPLRTASCKDQLNPILLMLRYTESYVRVGKGFQVEVHDW